MARTISHAIQRVLHEACKLRWDGVAERNPAEQACLADDIVFDFYSQTPIGREIIVTAWMSGTDYDTLIYDMDKYVDDCVADPENYAKELYGREIQRPYTLKDAIDDCEAERDMMYDFLEGMKKALTNI